MVLHCDSFQRETWNVSGYQNAGLSQKLLLLNYFKVIICFSVTGARLFSCEDLWSKHMLNGHSHNRSIYYKDLRVDHPHMQHHYIEEWDNLHDFGIKH